MLKTLDGKRIASVAHAQKFRVVLSQLGPERAAEVRSALHRIIDEMTPDTRTGFRTFSSSHLGSALTPWKHPLSHLYDVAWELEGEAAEDDFVEAQAAHIFGQFVWECIMDREEEWVFYDPNLSPSDHNREITGKVYFERGEEG
jgi:hypothetical protein